MYIYIHIYLDLDLYTYIMLGRSFLFCSAAAVQGVTTTRLAATSVRDERLGTEVRVNLIF